MGLIPFSKYVKFISLVEPSMIKLIFDLAWLKEVRGQFSDLSARSSAYSYKNCIEIMAALILMGFLTSYPLSYRRRNKK